MEQRNRFLIKMTGDASLDAPHFDDAAERDAVPVIPLDDFDAPVSDASSINPTTFKNPRFKRLSSFAPFIIAALVGGIAGGFALNFYLHRLPQKSVKSINTATSPNVAARRNTSAQPVEAEDLGMIVAAPTDSVNAADENDREHIKERVAGTALKREDDRSFSPAPAEKRAHAVADKDTNESPANDEPAKITEPRRDEAAVLIAVPPRHRTEEVESEKQNDGSTSEIEKQQKDESDETATATTSEVPRPIDRVRDIFGERPAREIKAARRRGINRVREIFEGASSTPR